MTKSIVQTLLELCRAWCRDHFPGEPVPGTDYPLDEEPFPHVQSKQRTFMDWKPNREQQSRATDLSPCRVLSHGTSGNAAARESCSAVPGQRASAQGGGNRALPGTGVRALRSPSTTLSPAAPLPSGAGHVNVTQERTTKTQPCCRAHHAAKTKSPLNTKAPLKKSITLPLN